MPVRGKKAAVLVGGGEQNYSGKEKFCRASSALGPPPDMTKRMKSFHIELTYG